MADPIVPDWKIDTRPRPEPPSPDPPQRRAYVDGLTGVLKAHGLCAGNEPGDVRVDVPVGFALPVGRWRWNGSGWEPYLPPPSRAQLDREDAVSKVAAAVADGTIPKKVRDALEAIQKVL